MKKIISLGFVFVLCLMVVFTSCDPLTGGGSITPPAELPAAPTSITAEADVEAVLVSWDASEGATAYNLYYTNNGTAPAKTSTKITLGNVTSYSLSNLSGTASSAATYRFAVAAVKSGIEGALSTVSNSIRPIPTIEVRFTGGTANAKMMLMVTPVNMDRTGATPVFVDFDTGELYTGFTTNASGAVYLKAPFNREKSVGFTLVYDKDGSGTLNAGDVVTGNGDPDTWGIRYFSDIYEYSFYTNQTHDGLTWHEYQP